MAGEKRSKIDTSRPWDLLEDVLQNDRKLAEDLFPSPEKTAHAEAHASVSETAHEVAEKADIKVPKRGVETHALHIEDDEEDRKANRPTSKMDKRIGGKVIVSFLAMIPLLIVLPGLKEAIILAGPVAIFSPPGFTVMITLAVAFLFFQAINWLYQDEKPAPKPKGKR